LQTDSLVIGAGCNAGKVCDNWDGLLVQKLDEDFVKAWLHPADAASALLERAGWPAKTIADITAAACEDEDEDVNDGECSEEEEDVWD
jgi:hypothetical protein